MGAVPLAAADACEINSAEFVIFRRIGQGKI
jgi:hypothetical protein